jgi:hypothetical protein
MSDKVRHTDLDGTVTYYISNKKVSKEAWEAAVSKDEAQYEQKAKTTGTTSSGTFYVGDPSTNSFLDMSPPMAPLMDNNQFNNTISTLCIGKG